jgi:hypothetical protein
VFYASLFKHLFNFLRHSVWKFPSLRGIKYWFFYFFFSQLTPTNLTRLIYKPKAWSDLLSTKPLLQEQFNLPLWDIWNLVLLGRKQYWPYRIRPGLSRIYIVWLKLVYHMWQDYLIVFAILNCLRTRIYNTKAVTCDAPWYLFCVCLYYHLGQVT